MAQDSKWAVASILDQTGPLPNSSPPWNEVTCVHYLFVVRTPVWKPFDLLNNNSAFHPLIQAAILEDLVDVVAKVATFNDLRGQATPMGREKGAWNQLVR